MPHIKNALLRYRIIDKCIRNKHKPFPSKLDLRHTCEEELFGSPEGNHICDSTIEKDLFAMRMEHDAPIKYSKKERGYYYSDENYSLDEIPLSADDIQSIKFAASTLAQFKDAAIFKQFGFALNKIIDRVAVSDNESMKDAENYIQFETGVANSGNEFLTPLLTAIKDQIVVYFDYASFISGKKKRRKVTPLLLKEYRNRWYVITFDHVKEDIITYSLDRTENLELTKEPGMKPTSFDPDVYFKHAVGVTTSKENPSEIILKCDKIAAKYIDSQPFHPSQELIKEGKKKTTFKLYALVTEELIRSLLSYSGEVEVVSPASLREELINRAKSMLSVYSVS